MCNSNVGQHDFNDIFIVVCIEIFLRKFWLQLWLVVTGIVIFQGATVYSNEMMNSFSTG